MTTTARAEFPEKPITLVVPFAAGGAERQDRPGLATAPEREKALGVRVVTDARLEPAEHKNSVYHPATPAMAEPARSGPIYKSEKFSDHAPVTIAYDRAF